GGRRGGNGSPNLEDLLSRGRDRFQGGVPGGTRLVIAAVAIGLILLWVVNSVYTVQPNEWAVKLRFGKPVEISQPGLNFALWPIETVEKASQARNRTEIGSVVGSRGSDDEGLMLSGDQNIVDVQFSVLWQVTDPMGFLFNVRAPEDTVRSIGESAMREVVGRRPAQDVFRDARGPIQIEVQQIVQEIADSYGMGIDVSSITIEEAAPPSAVADAFNEVQRAEQDEDRFQEEARQYANTLLGDARGQAAQIREDAAAYKDRVVQEAEGEASRFLSIYREYAKAPEVTRKRLFLETMEEVLGGSEKVLMESGPNGSGVVPYLPLPELRPNNASGNTNSDGASR
ncbi:FtsH protease activity modulator HflK, partial [Devosia sp.]|uniref:FtsH protease activity modulator HflK n=1 Tax=Devosia sp. TaxID=1871048 RepID=UPI003A8FB5DF